MPIQYMSAVQKYPTAGENWCDGDLENHVIRQSFPDSVSKSFRMRTTAYVMYVLCKTLTVPNLRFWIK